MMQKRCTSVALSVLPMSHAMEAQASGLTTALHDTAARSQPVLTASTDVTNTGSRRGEEIVQFYVRLIETSVAQPVRALKGFQRISLAPVKRKK